MKGLDLMAVKRNAPLIGAGIGLLVGALVLAFTGRRAGGFWLGRTKLPGLPHYVVVPRLVRIGAGAAIGAAAGAGTGAIVKKVA